jgi:predicted metalloendopeptidase
MKTNPLQSHLKALGIGMAAACAVATSPAVLATEPTASACTDFYAHINGQWINSTELPADRARIGSFDQLAISNTRLLIRALDKLLAEPQQQNTPGLRLLATWYGSALDPATAKAAGLRPAQPLLQRIDGLKDRAELPALLAEFTRHRLGGPLGMSVMADNQDVRRHIVGIGGSGIGLPDRDDYLKTDATSKRLQDAYRAYARQLLQLAGAAHDDASLDALMAFEKQLAESMLTAVERRNPQATNHRRTLQSLQAEAPGFDWTAWARASGATPERLRTDQDLMLPQPRHAQATARLAQDAPLAAWQTYLRVRLLDALSPWLDEPFQTASFDWKERVQRGLTKANPRQEQLINLIGGRTGWEPLAQTLGELFVRESFSPEAQARANRMIEDVRAAMRTRIDGLPWMSAATKQRAQEKLAAMGAQIGGPEKWPDYSALVLDPKDPAGNFMKVQAWGHAQRLADLPKPTDRNRWDTSPHIVNAFAAGQNRIVFPAGILQPPFFDAKASDASNYGGIGMVIGHEITHHFDDRGRQYDAVGNLKDWWAPEDAAAYKARADRVADFYSRYEVLPGLRINGRQMLGENISDLGGINIAFDALQLSLKRQNATAADAGAAAKQFFTTNALIWRGKQRPEALEQQIRTGQHSPGPFRVRGPLSNMPAFAQTYGCKPGDGMVAADPVSVW